MDKQFVNIDDLVRRRLSGIEEEERSGAWLNMRQLLDNEMPQKRAGFFNWRRMFSGMAVLLLLGSISLGGYELSSSVRGTGAQGSATAGKNTVTPVMRSANGSSSANSSNRSDNQLIAKADVRSGQLSDDPNSNALQANDAALSANEHARQVTGSNAATQPTSVSTSGNNSTASNNHNKNNNDNRNTSTTNSIASTTTSQFAQPELNRASTGNTNSDKTSRTDNHAAPSHANRVSGGSLTASVSGKRDRSADGRATTSSEHMASLPLGAGAVISSTGSHINSRTAAKHTAKHEVKLDNSSATGMADPDAAATSGSASVLASNSTGSSAILSKEKAGKHALPTEHGTLATNTRIAAILSKAVAARNADKHSNVHARHTTGGTAIAELAQNDNVADMPLSASTGAAPSIAAKTSGIATGTAKVTGTRLHSGSSAAMASAAPHKTTPNIVNGGTPAATKVGNEPSANASSTEAQDNTKHIEKLTLVYREQYYKTTDDNGYFKMDTISLHRSGGNGTVAKTGAKQNNNQTTTNNTTASVASSSALNKTSAGATNRNTASAEEAAEQPVANASTSITPATGNTSVAETPLASSSEEAPAASTPAKKELNAAKKSAGSTSTLEKLNEKFNDLKYHIKGCQFAPGLTAGVNSTFFAPESFKGFQFGFTGEFVFSESVSLMSELKYFHRLNNNYALEDNYYKYEQAGGMYKKVLQTNSYSFSTLHSLELPLSVRYTSGKFCFFAGGNFLYTFSINTGAVSTPGPATAPTYVSAIGDDNAPKVTERDFASRFGVGYLFGASYQVSPNVFFDIRNVQTVWDNSGTAGSKYVSGQLYKNPSVQVSIGYRFGGNRSTED